MGKVNGEVIIDSIKHPNKLGFDVINNISKRGLTINRVFGGLPPINQITLESTTRCSLKCRMCSHSKERNKKFKMKDMDWKLYKQIIDQLSNFPRNLLSGSVINFSGFGDPLMCKRIVEMTQYARTSLPHTIKFNLNTNGIFLTPEKSRDIIENLDTILISLNAPNKDDYIELMGCNKFDKVLSNIKDLLKIRKENNKDKLTVLIQLFEIFEESSNELSLNFKNYLDDNVRIFIRPFLNVPKKSISRKNIYDSLGKPLKKRKRIREPCPALIRGIAIDVEGNIYPCCQGLWCREDSDLSLGNIKDISLLEAFKMKKRQIEFMNQKHNVYGKEFKSCIACDSFSLGSTPYVYFDGLKRWF